MPMYHAWLAKPDEPGIAYDPTWNTVNAIYMGIAFRTAYVYRLYKANQEFGVIEARHYPLLHGVDSLADVCVK
jgi:hypothetical protein